MRWVVALLLVACGRYKFDPVPDVVAVDSAVDAGIDAAPCLPLSNCLDGEAFRCGSGTCYALCRDPADQPTQLARCQAEGAHLAAIRDVTDDQCLEAHMGATPIWYWIGLTQALGQSMPTAGWQWTTLEPLTYTNWRDPDPTPPGNPDDNDGIENDDEQCGWKNAPPLGQWEDARCNNLNPGVVCER